MTFRGRITLPEPTHVGFVKHEKVNAASPEVLKEYSCGEKLAEQSKSPVKARSHGRGDAGGFSSRNETVARFKSLLAIADPAGQETYTPGPSPKIPCSVPPEAASGAERCRVRRPTLNFELPTEG